VTGDELGDRCIFGDLERLARYDGADLALDLTQQLAQLALHLGVALARNRPPLALEKAALRVAGVLLATLDH
jgi:hypothetical protein